MLAQEVVSWLLFAFGVLAGAFYIYLGMLYLLGAPKVGNRGWETRVGRNTKARAVLRLAGLLCLSAGTLIIHWCWNFALPMAISFS